MTNDLLPCPFNHKHELERYITGDGTMVSCCSCGIEMHVDQWNTRANKPAEVDLARLKFEYTKHLSDEAQIRIVLNILDHMDRKGHLATGKGGGEPASPTQIDAGELEAAINKSGGPRLGDPGYIFTDMKTVKILRDAARAHLEKSKGGV